MSRESGNDKSMIYAVVLSVGAVVFVLFFVNLDFRFLGALFWSVVAGGAVLALLLARSGSPKAEDEPRLPPQKPVERVPAPAPAAPPQPKADAAAPVPEPPAEPKVAQTGTVGGSAVVRPTRPLAGQDEVSSFRGAWRYEGSGRTPGSGQNGPDRLSAPRDGQPDDLKRIKGIGPKLEQLCHSLGIYHFDQIAAWTEAEVAWVDANLEGFKGRVSRDGWVEQARRLAANGGADASTTVDRDAASTTIDQDRVS